jgi:hypothetical protein
MLANTSTWWVQQELITAEKGFGTKLNVSIGMCLARSEHNACINLQKDVNKTSLVVAWHSKIQATLKGFAQIILTLLHTKRTGKPFEDQRSKVKNTVTFLISLNFTQIATNMSIRSSQRERQWNSTVCITLSYFSTLGVVYRPWLTTTGKTKN